MTRAAGLAILVAALVAAGACSTGGNDPQPAKPPTGVYNIAVPGGEATAKSGGPGGAVIGGGGGGGGGDARSKLQPAEGKLAVDAPADAKAGAEAIAKITVTPGAGYHVNTEYPIKLTLAPADGLAVPKAEFIAGGHDKAKGDADALDEQNLTFSVKLTPAKTGSYTLNGTFKFAVCDKDQCLPKKEQIAIVVAAK